MTSPVTPAARRSTTCADQPGCTRLHTVLGNRLVPALLIALLLVVQAQRWFGRGSVGSVAAMQHKLEEQKSRNDQARLANERLASEVRDLKEGLEMVEEKARMELGMVKPNEIYVQIAK